MNQKDMANVYALQGGTAAWKNAGFPMEASAAKPAGEQTPPERPPVQ
jgi:3-mercaptopyruvate sulfurtransferase SseA